MQTDWDRTAMIVAKIHNVNCANKSDMVRDPSVFNPLRQQTRKQRVSIKELRQMMTGKK